MLDSIKNGYYRVGDSVLNNKYQSLIHASRTKANIQWMYYDDIFDKACETFKGFDMSLAEMYRIRAQQLRDEYDYLILYYSGGADSHNILHTFINNNIKLDKVFVQWPTSLMDKGLYTPNTQDRSNFNFHSEWDFCIKKDLEWLAKNHPNITIEIADWVETVNDNFYNDDMWLNNVTNLPSIARAQKQNTFPENEAKLVDMDLKVASIYGVDKLFFHIDKGKPRFRFSDNACMGHPNPNNPDGMEYFYWTPSMPEITVLQAHKLYQYFLANPDKTYMLEFGVGTDWYGTFDVYMDVYKYVCYPYWDFNRFQAYKPFSFREGLKAGVRPWDNILVKGLSDFERTQDKWGYIWKDYRKLIDDKYMIAHDRERGLFSNWHYLSLQS